jgi:hypothetical protein
MEHGRDSAVANRNRNIKGRGGAARIASGVRRGCGGRGRGAREWQMSYLSCSSENKI